MILGRIMQRRRDAVEGIRPPALVDDPVKGSAALIVLCAVGLLATIAVAGVPVPSVHDEFAYLLTGDTFAHGRLTNPTHPFWQHFETFHVIHEPSYQAKYPPAQGAFLAIGILLGHPIVGVWLSVLLMVAATAWSLLALLPARWAFFATLLLVLKLGIASYWAQSYWGGAVALLGGSLVFGTAARWIRGRPTITDGLLGGIGIAILANSRPLEGLVFTAVMGTWVGWTALRRREKLHGLATPLVAILALGIAGVGVTGVYNHAVTGSYTTFPYQVHTHQYALGRPLLGLETASSLPEYRHAEIERFYRVWDAARRDYIRKQGLLGVLRRIMAFVPAAGPGAVLLLFVPLIWRETGVKPALVAVVAVAIPVTMTAAAYSHYFAPALAPTYFLIGAAGRKLAARKGKPLGPALLYAVLAIAVFDTGRQVLELRADRVTWASRRQEKLEELRQSPGRDLIFVHYSPTHPVWEEWVYNRADIDDAPVVWSRTMDAASDSALAAYFHDRRIWDAYPDEGGRFEERPGEAER